MTANAITLFRLFLTFIVVAVFGRHTYIDSICIVTILIIFILDSVDGIVARKHDQTSTFGAVFDIAADRIVENVFWIYFASITDFIPFWMPVIVVTRGILTDGIRGIALTDGKTPFEMMTIPWTRALTSSRVSRALSGLSKILTFTFLPAVPVLESFSLNETIINTFSTASLIIAIVAVAINLIRGVPVLVDGWKYVKSSSQ